MAIGSQTPHSAPAERTLLDRLSALVLALHHIAGVSTAQQHQASCLKALQTEVPFDSGLWFTGLPTAAGPVAHAVHLDRQTPEMMAAYEHVKQHDLFAWESWRRPGQTLNICAEAAPFPVHPDMLAHTRRFGMTHALSTMFVEPVVNLFTGVAIYRADMGHPFSEAERQIHQAVVPHMVATLAEVRLRSVAGGPPPRGPDRARALCDQRGLLHTASPGLAELLRAEWPGWEGPALPPALQGNWLQQEHARYSGAAVVVVSEPMGDLLLLKVRRVVALDALTPRELQVARRYGSGLTHQAIAADLRVAPATVRNHLQTVYDKLGLGNKAELALLLREADD